MKGKFFLCFFLFLLLESSPVTGQGVLLEGRFFFWWKEVASLLAEDLCRQAHFSGDYPSVVVASFLEEDDFSRSSPLGRLLAELLAEELHLKGFTILEARLTRSFLLRRREGEFVLSRRAREVFKQTGAHAVVTGVISRLGGRLFIQAKMISLSDSRVISLASLELLNPPSGIWGVSLSGYDRLLP